MKRSRLNPIGKIGRKWIETRKEWIGNNPEPWTCANCHKALDIETLTVDHILSRSRRPDLRFVQSNLQAMCWGCNSLKGSRDHA